MTPENTGQSAKSGAVQLGNTDEVQDVRSIFEWYLAGTSVRGITRRMNEADKTRDGKPWIPSTVQRTLANDTYTGTYRWNHRHIGKYHGIADGQVSDSTHSGVNSSADWIVIPNNHPAIVDKVTFDKVQGRLAERKVQTTPHVNGGKFVLTGLIRCGKCGGSMFGTVPRKTQGVTYVCATDHQTGKCDRNAAKQDELLNHIVDAVVERFTNPDVERQLRESMEKQVKKSTSKVNATTVSKQLATINTKLEKAKRRLLEVDSDMVAVVSDHIRELTNKRDELTTALKAASVSPKRLLSEAVAKVEAAMGLFSELRETLDKADTVQLRELLSRTIERVEVWSIPTQHGKRRLFNLQRGVIYLRGDQFKNLSHSIPHPPLVNWSSTCSLRLRTLNVD